MEQTSQLMGAGLLSAAIWIPILTGIILLAIGDDRRADLVRAIALIGALLGLLVTLPLYLGFDPASAELQFVEKHAVDRPIRHRLLPRRRRAVDLAGAADRPHHRDRRGRGLACDHRTGSAVHGVLPDPVGSDGRASSAPWTVCCSMCSSKPRCCRCTSSSASGAGRTASTPPSSSFSTRCWARCSRWSP